MLGAGSQAELFIVDPRFTGVPQASYLVSFVVTHKCQSTPKKSDRPSAEMLGAYSAVGLFTVVPRFSVSPHSSSIVARVVNHRSWSSTPPGRNESKNNRGFR